MNMSKLGEVVASRQYGTSQLASLLWKIARSIRTRDKLISKSHC
jgi:hypothetical protein